MAADRVQGEDDDRGDGTDRPVDALEAALLVRAREGDGAAFEKVVRRHAARVHGVALRIVRQPDVAEDVAQEAFLKAFRALSRFDLQRPFAPWVCRIAANLAVNHVRSPRQREQGLPDQEPIGHRPAADDPLERVLDAEADRMLDGAMQELSIGQRAVFVLRTVEELSYREIAQALGISEGTVMSRLARARGRLRIALAAYLGPAVRTDLR